MTRPQASRVSGSWVATSTIMPCPARFPSTWLTECAVRVSNCAVGSSTSSMSGLEHTARASMSRCASPPDSSLNRRSAAYSKSNSPMASNACGSASRRRSPWPAAGTRHGPEPSPGHAVRVLNTQPTRSTFCVPPCHGTASPIRQESTAASTLPHPDGPHIATVWPGIAVKSRCSNNTSVPGNLCAKSCTLTDRSGCGAAPTPAPAYTSSPVIIGSFRRSNHCLSQPR